MSANPVRDVTRVVRGENDVKEVRALTFEERTDLFAKLDADPKAVQYELPDLLRGMLATGLRIGELVATIGDDFSKDPRSGKPVLRADWRIVRVTGVGLVRKRRTNSGKGVGQRLLLPSWAVPMFTARKLASGGDGPLFPHVVTREWRDPGGALQRQLRDALDRAGYTWVTSHVMRKTVANVLDQAGVDTGLVAAQLGQRSKEITERHYIERRVSTDGAEQVLETMWAQAEGRSQSCP
jgi:integrase